jgi:hypothetical protein
MSDRKASKLVPNVVLCGLPEKSRMTTSPE